MEGIKKKRKGVSEVTIAFDRGGQRRRWASSGVRGRFDWGAGVKGTEFDLISIPTKEIDGEAEWETQAEWERERASKWSADAEVRMKIPTPSPHSAF